MVFFLSTSLVLVFLQNSFFFCRCMYWNIRSVIIVINIVNRYVGTYTKKKHCDYLPNWIWSLWALLFGKDNEKEVGCRTENNWCLFSRFMYMWSDCYVCVWELFLRRISSTLLAMLSYNVNMKKNWSTQCNFDEIFFLYSLNENEKNIQKKCSYNKRKKNRWQ